MVSFDRKSLRCFHNLKKDHSRTGKGFPKTDFFFLGKGFLKTDFFSSSVSRGLGKGSKVNFWDVESLGLVLAHLARQRMRF